MNKTITSCLTAALSALTLSSIQSQAVSLDFSNIPGSSISFDGAGNFTFSPAGANLQIDSGSAQGLLGAITGTFSIGAVSPDGSGFSASVSNSGTFTIIDGGTPLTADISFDTIFQKGTGSTLNVNGIVNLSNINYTGSNIDLAALDADGSGIASISFQFVPARSLAAIKSTAGSTSFSGSVASVSTPDGGSSAMLLALGLVGLGSIARRKA